MRTERGTTIRSRELGEELRLARKRIQLRAEKLSQSLGWSAGKISRLEHGSRGTSDFDLGALLGRLEADPTTRDRIRRLAEEPDIGYFLRTHDGRIADSLTCLTIHEQAASGIYKYEPMLISGLLQTERYARAVIDPDGKFDPEDRAMMVGARMNRQSILSSTTTTIFIHETALRTSIGGHEVMHDQLLRLVFMCGWNGLTIRVIPLAAPGELVAPGHPALRHGHTLLTFPRVLSPVAYTETDFATVFSEESNSIERYRLKHRTLDSLALSVEQSQAVIAYWANVYDRREEPQDERFDLA
ncbi:helix-turn-helix transcriptional regulator [Saccharothrix violaceirubra]|uniref:Transcriptional regulator with XRE-family HTH domain n=1 Tax=Saccharothrix violaceirubra TaxID=413306 RepID=A0A7W7WZW4_9PSEU|nr:helix-turn-helix transcriptional regulator [Saccharothrix violaceirubra]MBB4969301.1 transcriptional regulator with XRE-family HTH domain [Saccharothrix violaceirubra]